MEEPPGKYSCRFDDEQNFESVGLVVDDEGPASRREDEKGRGAAVVFGKAKPHQNHSGEVQQPLATAYPEQTEVQDKKNRGCQQGDAPYQRAGVAYDGIRKEKAEVQDRVNRPCELAVLGDQSHATQYTPHSFRIGYVEVLGGRGIPVTAFIVMITSSILFPRQLRIRREIAPAAEYQTNAAAGISTSSQGVPP